MARWTQRSRSELRVLKAIDERYREAVKFRVRRLGHDPLEYLELGMPPHPIGDGLAEHLAVARLRRREHFETEALVRHREDATTRRLAAEERENRPIRITVGAELILERAQRFDISRRSCQRVSSTLPDSSAFHLRYNVNFVDQALSILYGHGGEDARERWTGGDVTQGITFETHEHTLARESRGCRAHERTEVRRTRPLLV